MCGAETGTMALFRLISIKGRLDAGRKHVARHDASGLDVRLSGGEIGLELVQGRQGRIFGLVAHDDMILGMAGVVIKDRRRIGRYSATGLPLEAIKKAA
jgi:hypothetical protein